MSNFWKIYSHECHIALADADGNEVRINLCRDKRGRLGVVWEAPAYSLNPGRLTADFGPDIKGFKSIEAAREYADERIS